MTFIRASLPDPVTYFEAQGLHLKGRGKWRSARCPLHGGESLRLNIETGAYVCMGGCDFHGGDVLAFHMAAHGLEFQEAARALGAWAEDGRPLRGRVKPAPLPPRAALQVLGFEATLTAVAAGNLARGVVLSDADRDRLLRAAGRIHKLVEVFA